MSILDQNLILFAVMTEFLATTPVERIEQEHHNSVVEEIKRLNSTLKENAAYRTTIDMARENGFFDNDGILTRKGHARSLASLKAPMRPSYRSVNYDALLEEQQFKGLLLLASKVCDRLDQMVGSFDKFEPSEQVQQLLEEAADKLYKVAGIETVTDEVEVQEEEKVLVVETTEEA